MFDIESYVFNKNAEPALKKEWVSVLENSIIHTRAIFPKKLIESRMTKLPKEIIEYIEANYECLTADPINKSIESIVKYITHSNYNLPDNIELPNVLYDNVGYSFIDFHIQVLIPLMLEDPNAILYWSNKNNFEEQLTNKKADIIPIIVSSEKIKDIGDDYFVYNNGVLEIQIDTYKVVHDTYRIVSKEAEYDLIPYYENGILEYRKELHYEYNFTNNSFIRLGGRKTRNAKGESYLISYFAGIYSWANDFIRIYQHFKPIHTRMSTPIIQIKPSICNAKGCQDGIVKSNCVDNVCDEKECSTCKGTGHIHDYTPYSTIIKPETKLGANHDNEDVIKYITPPIEAVKASEETSFRYLAILKEACNIMPVGTNNSGISKEIDRQQKYDQIELISNQSFNVIQFSLNSVRDIYNPNVNTRDDIVVLKPNKIDLDNESTFLEITKDLSVPYQIRIVNALKYFDKLYSDSLRDREINKYIILKDSLSLMSSLEIIQLKAAGMVSDEQVKIHKYIKGLVLNYFLDDYSYDIIDKRFMSDLDNIFEEEIIFNAE